MEKTNGNAFPGEEINGEGDEELQPSPNTVHDSPASNNSSSEMEYSSSTTDDDALPRPQSSTQQDSAIGSSSSEIERSSSIAIEESPPPSQPGSSQYDSVISDSSCGIDDISSSPDDDDSYLKEALERERSLGLRRCYPIIWAGDLIMGLLKMEISIKFITGDTAVSRAALPPGHLPDLTIHIRRTQAFDTLQRRDLKKKMLTKEENCVLLAVPIDNDSLQAGIMEQQFIHLFRRKKAVGVVDFPDTDTSTEFPDTSTEKPKYRMLLFPPSDFVFQNLSKVAPTLANSLYEQTSYPHLLCLISTTGS